MHSHFHLFKVMTKKLQILIKQKTEQLQHLERSTNIVNNSATYEWHKTKTCTEHFTKTVKETGCMMQWKRDSLS